MPEINLQEAEIKLYALNDLFYFTKYILGYNLLDEKVHGDLCDFIVNTPGDVLDLEPRDHFKTTCIIGYAIWSIMKDRSHKILINQKTLKKAKQILREIKGHFEENRILRYFFGDMVGKVWKEDEIILKGTKTGKDPNISVGSVDHPNTGSHYTIIINDDICELADRYSEAERDATLRFYKAIQYLRDKGRNPREINIGTRWHMNDLWNHIMTNIKHVTVRVRKAFLDDGTPYLPSRYTVAQLNELRSDDVEFFETVMMQNPLMDSDRWFKLDELTLYDPQAIDYELGITKAYEDPALSSKQTACDTALAVGTQIGSEIYLKSWELWRVNTDIGMNNVLDTCERSGVMELRVESNQAFKLYADDLRAIKDARGMILSITDAPATTDKMGRIHAAVNFIKQNVRFRKDWQTAYPKAMTQLLEAPQSKRIDGPDALEGLCSMFATFKTPRIRQL